MLSHRSSWCLPVLVLVQACAGPRGIGSDASPMSAPVPIECGQPAELEFRTLTALRRAQGRPDPLRIEVFVETPMKVGPSEVGIRLWHRDGEPEPFDFDEPDGMPETHGPRFELVVTDGKGQLRTSVIEPVASPTEHFGPEARIYFVPGYVWGEGAIPEVLGAVPAPRPRLVEPHRVSPFPLRGYEWDPPLAPGGYTLTVRLHQGWPQGEVTIDSDPVDFTIL